MDKSSEQTEKKSYKLENDCLQVTVQTFGAELSSIINKENNQEYLWQADPKFWNRHAPVLFPIVGRLKDNAYTYNGKNYTLPQHGFARDMVFSLKDQSEDELKFSLKHQNETLENYPFKFEFEISYKLIGSAVKVSYRISNIDNKEIYFSVGAHPAFICPLNLEEKFDDYYLEFDEVESAERHLLSNGLFNNKTESVLESSNQLPLTYGLFEKDAIVFKNLKSTTVSLKSKKSNNGVKFSFNGFPYLGIWTKNFGAPFLCIEPWCGLADNEKASGYLSEKEGIIKLLPDLNFKRSFDIQIF